MKSNSCSSRLELAGTDQERNSANEARLVSGRQHKDENYDGKLMEDLEEEETVKDLIYKLERKQLSASATTKPRIIESRCIEKNNIFPIKEHPKVTVNSQAFDNSKTYPNIEPRNEYEEYVTVNNHISISNKKPQDENESNGKVYSGVQPKVIRNKNVDLAFLAAAIKKSSKGFNASETELSENLNEVETSTRGCDNSSRTTSLEMKNNQRFSISPDVHEKSLNASASESSLNKTNDKATKMVNWGTVGIINKEYFMNDSSLVQHKAKMFDEMEFEEFEVAGEHYDSLNSK